jgi:hypothetical protein
MQQGVSKDVPLSRHDRADTHGGYTDRSLSKKAVAWLLLVERKEGKRILHGRKRKEHQIPKVPRIRVPSLYETDASSGRAKVTVKSACRFATLLHCEEARQRARGMSTTCHNWSAKQVPAKR